MARTPMGAITCFFQLNNGVIIMSGSNMMDAEIELRTNERHITDYIELFFSSHYGKFDQKRKIMWSTIFCVISLNLSETLVCWSVRASLVK